MHLLFSEEVDFSTNRVIDWLYYNDEKYEKHIDHNKAQKDHFNFEDKTIAVSFGGNITDPIFKVNDIKDPVDINSTWFRRPTINSKTLSPEKQNFGVYPKEYLEYSNQKRMRTFWDFLCYNLQKTKKLGSYEIVDLNKPIILKKAQEHNLTIPKTLITNSIDELRNFFNLCNQKIITKSLGSVIPEYKHQVNHPKDHYLSFYQLTKLIDNIDTAPKKFAPSLFQECIDKEYEIRSIYLNGELYSACIFSQLNEQTKVDMRNRPANHPTRYIPYQLNQAIESSITSLMQELTLDYGAIDIIKGIDGQYYFLEINPVGQYGDVSLQCNYYLNKKIAEYLINNSND
ncbi:grasp-with-spasm system ATP-grasp peptide maturase [Aquimarina sp. D1M17]|uniref:grasp-with-spasm system ATP-grasp peptide maturase n=1 Tax=Aquimarina acroporae TaxID=2937283 RepID=UPI0020BE26EF|nr:grasp-with-spasm system ATP-grasp peptide maturase [Aquimarina acroporae]MCK8522513.1 grasp-with-spasm system ATP-grasp peptide maturase [Aquimarina acroporae]